MTYRTVTVTPAINNNITVSGGLFSDMITVTPGLSESVNVSAQVTNSIITADTALISYITEVEAEIKTEIVTSESGYYTGPYEWTPTQDTQIVNIQAKTATQNITINPIPSNYGLITYNGAILTVS